MSDKLTITLSSPAIRRIKNALLKRVAEWDERVAEYERRGEKGLALYAARRRSCFAATLDELNEVLR